jgi:tetratricopeptide (TPR) repeat protein/SAM-dependent methyltransferase
MNRKERRAGRKQLRRAVGGAGLHPEIAEAFARAVQHHRLGQLREAEALFLRVLALDGKHLDSLRGLGALALQTGRSTMAVDALSKALALDDALPECHYNIALAFEQLRQPQQAIAHYRRAAALKPDLVQAYANLGNALRLQGALAEAVACYGRVIELQPRSAEAAYNLANVLAEQGRLDEAILQYQRALQCKPAFVEAHVSLGTVHVLQGKRSEALIHFRRALEIDPKAVEARVNIGNVLSEQGDQTAAAAELQEALKLRPDHAEAHSNLGTVLSMQGSLDAAATHYQRAIALRPELAEAHMNLGLVCMAQGKLEEADQCYRQALFLRPNYAEAFNNVARLFLIEGKIGHAMDALTRSLAIGETLETKTLFVESLRDRSFVPESAELRQLVMRALSEPWGRPGDVALAATAIVEHNPDIRRAIGWLTDAWPARLRVEPAPGELGAVFTDPLLRQLMASARIVEPDMERLLTALRFALLQRAASAAPGEVDGPALAFCCALAWQCFTNEYVFTHTDAEFALALRLQAQLASAFQSRAAVAEFNLAVVACYFPLAALPGAQALRDRHWSEPITGLIVQQLQEVELERQDRSSIPTLTEVDDEISLKVQEQYEEHPYPRWGKLAPAVRSTTVDQYLRRKFPTVAFRSLGKGAEFDVLIAGCGTDHGINAAQRFPRARVLAIDLSLTSLAYSKYKSRALDLANLTFGQADILKLASLGRSFDVIESAGVLHHLAEPFDGWRILLSLLRPAGFMMVALYSELARQPLAPVRAFIAEGGYRPTADDIRRCRVDLMNSGEPALTSISFHADFCSVSTFRDLVFHAQEHRLTLPAIEAFLAQNDLEFIGFETDAQVRRRYAVQFPQDPTMTNLGCWHAFETENPRTFLNMYQFWVQKRGEPLE